MSNCVIKIFVEEGLETSLYGLGAEVLSYLYFFFGSIFDIHLIS